MALDADKKKALAAARRSLEKKYGSEIIYDTKVIKTFDTISTGSAIIDDAIGIKPVSGFPRGRLVEIYGPEASGKCLVGNTYINTANGLLTVAEIFEENNIELSNVASITPVSYTLLNEFGVKENTLRFTCNGNREVTNISTRLGNSIEATSNHPLRVLDSAANIIWKEVGEIQEGDYLVSKTIYQEDMSSLTPSEEAEATLLGLILADGCVHSDTSFRFNNSDPDVLTAYNKALNTLFPTVVNKQYGNDYQADSATLIRPFYKKVGITEFPCKAKDKQLPPYIRRQSTEYIKNVLRNFIECECNVDLYKTSIEVTSASETLMRQVKYELQTRFGIVSSLHLKTVQLDSWEKPRNYYRLLISGTSFDQYIERIGFTTKARLSSLENYVKASRNTNILSVPNVAADMEALYRSLSASNKAKGLSDAIYDVRKGKCGLTLSNWIKIKNLIINLGFNSIVSKYDTFFEEGLFFDKVVSKSIIGIQPTFDFEMEHSASFIANGIRSHNTSICMSSVAQAQLQYPDLLVLYIDTEQAFNLEYAKKFGVNVSEDAFMFVQPDSAEQALQVMREMAETGAFSVIVLDSVAAMATDAQLGKDSDEKTMGSLAGVLSPELNKIKTALSKTNTLGIFINQIREKIGKLLQLNLVFV